MIVVILVINVAMVAAFVLFYRKKRKYWSKRVGVSTPPPSNQSATAPPPIPTRPSSSHAGVILKSPYNQPQGVNRQRIQGLHNSMTSLPRGDQEC